MTGARRVRFAAALAAAWTLAPAARAQPSAADQDCGLLCTTASQAELLRALQAPPIQTLAQTVTSAYRALAADAWGRPMPAITFTRTANAAPQVEVRIALAGRTDPVVSRWAISEAGWSAAASAVEGLPQAFQGYRRQSKARTEMGPNGEPGEIVVCADGWSYRLESASGGVAASVAGSCPDPTEAAYDRLAQIAISTSPHCAKAGPFMSARVIECLAADPDG